MISYTLYVMQEDMTSFTVAQALLLWLDCVPCIYPYHDRSSCLTCRSNC